MPVANPLYPGLGEDEAARMADVQLLLGTGDVPGYGKEISLPDSPPASRDLGGMTATTLPGGDVEYDLSPDSNVIPFNGQIAHDANLAEHMDEKDLIGIAQDLLQKIDADYSSMERWRSRLQEAMVLLGADAKLLLENSDTKDEPFPGAASVVHPMLAEAVVQFNARAMKELMPPGGPVKTYVKGTETAEWREKAERVREHMNYQITYEDEAYEDDMDTMLFYLPFTGSAFKKTYYDTASRKTISRFIPGSDVICPYIAKSLETSPRITHSFPEYHNDLLKKQANGYYRDKLAPQPGAIHEDEITEDVKLAEGREASIPIGDEPHRIYECHTYLNLPGFDDEEGVASPYIVTLEKDSQTILSIRRNWEEGDELRERQPYFVHYRFLPGLGMYGYGYLHMIGDLVTATTGAMRSLLDAAAFASMQGGFVAFDARMNKGDFVITPGIYKPVNIPADELAKAFYTPSFKEPSQALVSLFQHLEETGRRFMSTTDALVGDAKNTGPVGTTVALIEQSSQVMTGVHKRIHKAQGREFQIRARLNKQYLPQEGMYFNVKGGERQIFPDDYDDQIEIIPVSDPGVSSVTEKISKAQVVLERAAQVPDLYDRYNAEAYFLDVVGISDKESILKKPDDAAYVSPVIEGAMLVAGKPIKAYYEQNHKAHNAVHQAQMQYYASLPPERAQPIMIKMQEHIARHDAYDMYQAAYAMMGLPAEPIDLDGEEKESSLPPQVENALAVQEAQSVGQLSEFLQSLQPQPAKDMEAEAKIKRDDAAFQAEEQRKNAAYANEQQRKAQAPEAGKEQEPGAGQAQNDNGTLMASVMQALDGIAQTMKQIAQMNIQANSATAQAMAGMAEQMGTAMRAVAAPKRVVFENGKPVGIVPVEGGT